MNKKIRLGISACLLGESVRYDGGNKLDRSLRDTLGEYVEWVGVCPEVECGLGIPREAMRLVGTAAAPRLVTRTSGIDHTDRMRAWIKKRLTILARERLGGFVLKSRSPSCGVSGVSVRSCKGKSARPGRGLFATALVERFPDMVVIDDDRLHDPSSRAAFVARVKKGYRGGPS